MLVALCRADVNELPLDVLAHGRQTLEAHLKLDRYDTRAGMSKQDSGKACVKAVTWNGLKNLDGLSSTVTLVTLMCAIVDDSRA